MRLGRAGSGAEILRHDGLMTEKLDGLLDCRTLGFHTRDKRTDEYFHILTISNCGMTLTLARRKSGDCHPRSWATCYSVVASPRAHFRPLMSQMLRLPFKSSQKPKRHKSDCLTVFLRIIILGKST